MHRGEGIRGITYRRLGVVVSYNACVRAEAEEPSLSSSNPLWLLHKVALHSNGTVDQCRRRRSGELSEFKADVFYMRVVRHSLAQPLVAGN